MSIIGVGSSALPALLIFKTINSQKILLVVFTLELFLFNFLTFILYLFTNYNQNNLIFWHVLLVGELLNSLFYQFSLKNKLFQYLTILNGILILLSFSIIYFNTSWSEEIRLSVYSTILNVSFSILSIFLIVNRYAVSTETNLLNDKIFVLSSATLIYYGLQLYVISFESIIRIEAGNLFFITWSIVQISTIFFHILISRLVWVSKN